MAAQLSTSASGKVAGGRSGEMGHDIGRSLTRITLLLVGDMVMLKRSRIALVLLCASLFAGLFACAPQTVLLVRHGEKLDESADAALSPAGEARAHELAEHLAPLQIRAIFVSEWQRTQKTAQPLAQRLNIQPQVIPSADRAMLLSGLRALPKSDIALVVGHSNTLPLLFAELGVPTAARPNSIEYGDLFIVIRKSVGAAKLLKLHY